MEYALVFALLIAAVCASPLGLSSAPAPADAPSVEPITTTQIPILKQELSIENGTFVNNFATGHGIVVSESGSQKQIDSGSGTVSSGSFSFTNPDGAVITVTWIANENGFQASGDHLPTPPPTPDHVVKMLADMEAALDAISIATEKPAAVALAAGGTVVEASQEPVPAASAPVQVEVVAIESVAVEPAPVVRTPAEVTPARDSLDDAVLAEPSADAAVPAEFTPLETAPVDDAPAASAPVESVAAPSAL